MVFDCALAAPDGLFSARMKKAEVQSVGGPLPLTPHLRARELTQSQGLWPFRHLFPQVSTQVWLLPCPGAGPLEGRLLMRHDCFLSLVPSGQGLLCYFCGVFWRDERVFSERFQDYIASLLLLFQDLGIAIYGVLPALHSSYWVLV